LILDDQFEDRADDSRLDPHISTTKFQRFPSMSEAMNLSATLGTASYHVFCLQTGPKRCRINPSGAEIA
jgi:hypothetical protein